MEVKLLIEVQIHTLQYCTVQPLHPMLQNKENRFLHKQTILINISAVMEKFNYATYRWKVYK